MSLHIWNHKYTLGLFIHNKIIDIQSNIIKVDYDGDNTDIKSLKGDTDPGDDKLVSELELGLGWLDPTLPALKHW